jgi:hypothetical protein
MQSPGTEVLPVIGTVVLTPRTISADAEGLPATCEPGQGVLRWADRRPS